MDKELKQNTTPKKSNAFLLLSNILTVLLVWRSNYSTSQFFVAYFTSIIYIALFLVWFLIACNIDSTFLTRVVKNSWTLLIFLFVNIFLDLINYTQIRLEQVNCLIALFMYCIFIFYKDRKDCNKFKKFILWVILIDFLIKILYSIQQISINPAIIKQMSTEGASDSREVSILIADYSTVYACVMISVFLMGLFKKLESKAWRIATVVTIVILVYFIFICSFFMALLLLVYGVVSLFFKEKKYYYVVVPLVVLFVVLILRQPLSSFCAFMSKQDFWSAIIQGKWDDMSKLLAYGSDHAYMSDMRLDLMKKSLTIFSDYPFFGIYSMNTKLKIGGHSGWLDGLANYGIFRYSFFVAFLVMLFKNTCNHSAYKTPIFSTISVYALLSIVNPNVFPQVWIIFSVLIPFYCDLAKSKGSIKGGRLLQK